MFTIVGGNQERKSIILYFNYFLDLEEGKILSYLGVGARTWEGLFLLRICLSSSSLACIERDNSGPGTVL